MNCAALCAHCGQDFKDKKFLLLSFIRMNYLVHKRRMIIDKETVLEIVQINF